MKRNNTGRTILVILLIAWAVTEMLPPFGRSIVDVFLAEATKVDDSLKNAAEEARKLTAEDENEPPREFRHLQSTVSQLVLTNHFNYSVKGERDPNAAILKRVQNQAAGKIRFGLDLQGGSSFIVGLDSNKVAEASDPASLQNQAIEVLRARVDKYGVAEPIIRAEGNDRIIIQMPGLTESERGEVITNLTKPAVLHFRMVHPDSDRLTAAGLMAPGYKVLPLRQKTSDGGYYSTNLLVRAKPEQGLTGKFISSAYVDRDPFTLQPSIAFSFNNEGALIFAEVTRENIGNRLAIVLDGELKSAPRINSEIQGNGVIEGDFTYKEAAEVAQVLENPLETPVKLLDVEEVDPSLGRDSVASGSNAAIIGIVAVAIFMLCYYMVSGVIANVALILNMILLLGTMCAMDATFTLPGIAGIVLTIGMAVDANVLIYERIREELAAGKSMRGSLNAGYEKAWGTIFDSNVTTLIASTILIYMGTGPVKGFGVTLTIGICASMFTALVVTRLLYDFLLDRNLISELKMLSVINANSKIDFLSISKPAAMASVVILLIGVVFGIGVKGKSALGVDFIGGDAITYSVAKKVEQTKIRALLDKTEYAEGKTVGGDATIQYQKNYGDATERLRITSPAGSGEAVTTALKAEFGDAGIKELSTRRVGAVIGGEILKTAFGAVILSLFGILFYVGVRFEFSFSVAAVIAVIHDFIVTLGLFVLLGGQLSAPIVAALLTVIGFSINDTIVIFDRIREDLKLGIRGTFQEVINKALNQTLSRTIITSGTTLIAVLSLVVFGGGVINDFALTLLIGVVVGTYSSIYVASATVLWWHKGERPKMSSPQVYSGAVANASAAEPAN